MRGKLVLAADKKGSGCIIGPSYACSVGASLPSDAQAHAYAPRQRRAAGPHAVARRRNPILWPIFHKSLAGPVLARKHLRAELASHKRAGGSKIVHQRPTQQEPDINPLPFSPSLAFPQRLAIFAAATLSPPPRSASAILLFDRRDDIDGSDAQSVKPAVSIRFAKTSSQFPATRTGLVPGSPPTARPGLQPLIVVSAGINRFRASRAA